MSYVEFELFGKTKSGKTSIYEVINRKIGIVVGKIKWFGSFRQYCLFPSEGTVFNKKCMEEINNFIDNLMNKRKVKLNRV